MIKDPTTRLVQFEASGKKSERLWVLIIPQRRCSEWSLGRSCSFKPTQHAFTYMYRDHAFNDVALEETDQEITHEPRILSCNGSLL
jgi:hypothetical protein